MSRVTLSISLPEELLRDLDRVAVSESRSRSELVRVAVRAYIDHKSEWTKTFAEGRELARRRKLKPSDVAREIAAYRREKAAGR